MAETLAYDDSNGEAIWFDSTASSWTVNERASYHSDIDTVRCIERIPGGGWLLTVQYTDVSGWHAARYTEDFQTREWRTALSYSPVFTYRGVVTDGDYAYAGTIDSYDDFNVEAYDLSDGSSVWTTRVESGAGTTAPLYPTNSGVVCCWSYSDFSNSYIRVATVDQSGNDTLIYDNNQGYDRYQIQDDDTCVATDILVDSGNNYIYIFFYEDSTGTRYTNFRVLDFSGNHQNDYTTAWQGSSSDGSSDMQQSGGGFGGYDYDANVAFDQYGFNNLNTNLNSCPTLGVSFNKNDNAIGYRNSVWKYDSSGNLIWEGSESPTIANEYPRSSASSTWNEVDRSITEEVSATQVSTSASMNSATFKQLKEYVSATGVSASASMASPVLTEYATATTVDVSATMDAPSLTEKVTSTQVSAAASPNETFLKEYISATQVNTGSGMLSGSVQTVEHIAASPFGASTAMSSGTVRDGAFTESQLIEPTVNILNIFDTADAETWTQKIQVLPGLNYSQATGEGLSTTTLSGTFTEALESDAVPPSLTISSIPTEVDVLLTDVELVNDEESMSELATMRYAITFSQTGRRGGASDVTVNAESVPVQAYTGTTQTNVTRPIVQSFGDYNQMQDGT